VNIRKKVYGEYIGLRLTKEEYDLIVKKLCRRKEDKLSQKLREYIFTKLSEEPVREYSIKQNEGLTGVILYENGQEVDKLFFDNIDEAMKRIRAIGAIKKRK